MHSSPSSGKTGRRIGDGIVCYRTPTLESEILPPPAAMVASCERLRAAPRWLRERSAISDHEREKMERMIMAGTRLIIWRSYGETNCSRKWREILWRFLAAYGPHPNPKSKNQCPNHKEDMTRAHVMKLPLFITEHRFIQNQ